MLRLYDSASFQSSSGSTGTMRCTPLAPVSIGQLSRPSVRRSSRIRNAVSTTKGQGAASPGSRSKTNVRALFTLPASAGGDGADGAGGVEAEDRWGTRVAAGEAADQGMVPDDGIHPTDYVPRLVQAVDWAVLERGLALWMRAINEWLRSLEAGKDEVVPREVVESSALFDASILTRFGDVPNRQMGFDIVAVERSGGWEYLVIEDNTVCRTVVNL